MIASLRLGYTPSGWGDSKVLFIPKVGKKDYAELRSFIPISLTSFMLKTMEKLILWNLEANVFQTNPLHKEQHGFWRGYSMESALSASVNDIES